MNSLDTSSLIASANQINSSREFQAWVRFELRKCLPHACFLATLGKLYGIGSVPTHRIGVDFPLNMIEELKNHAGAIDDPLMYGWFRSGKPRYVEVRDVEEFGGQQRWREVMVQYGMRSMLVHGVLDHKRRRFAVFQIGNPCGTTSFEVGRLVTLLLDAMTRAAWATVDSRGIPTFRGHLGHPILSLTPTELHIIELLAQGLSNKEIARLRGVSDSTIKTQVQRTGAKLGATRRAEIVAIAMPLLSPLPAQNLVDYDGFK